MASDNILFHQRHRAGFGRVLAMLKLGKSPEEIGEACEQATRKFLRTRDGKWPELMPVMRLLVNACGDTAEELPGLFPAPHKIADFGEMLDANLRAFDGSPTADVVRDFAEKMHARCAMGSASKAVSIDALLGAFAQDVAESIFVRPMMDDFGARANAGASYLASCTVAATAAVGLELLNGWSTRGKNPAVPVSAESPLAVTSDAAR